MRCTLRGVKIVAASLIAAFLIVLAATAPAMGSQAASRVVAAHPSISPGGVTTASRAARQRLANTPMPARAHAPAPMATPTPTPSVRAELRVLPAQLALRPGEVGVVEVAADASGFGASGFSIDLEWDPDLVEVVDQDPFQSGVQVALGTMFQGGELFLVENSADNERGTLTYVAFLLHGQTATSHGTVLRVAFLAKGPNGSSTVRFGPETCLVDTNGQLLPLYMIDGQVLVSGVSATPNSFGRVRGMVYEDLNANGWRDAWESGVSDVMVMASSETRPYSGTVVSGEDGCYDLSGLDPDIYRIRPVCLPFGFIYCGSDYVLTVHGGDDLVVDLGLERAATRTPTRVDALYLPLVWCMGSLMPPPTLPVSEKRATP